MKRHTILIVLFATLVFGTIAQAQERGGAPQTPAGEIEVLRTIPLLGALRQQAGQPTTPVQGQRGAGGRGPGAGIPGNANGTTPDTLNGAYQIGLRVNRAVQIGNNSTWWTNNALLTRLGVSDDQRVKLEQAFARNRQNLTASKDVLEREEAQLSKLLDVDQVDRAGVATQINKVVQARGEMERINSLMTLDMREVLTRAQWSQLQLQQGYSLSLNTPRGAGLRGGGLGGPAGGGGLGAGGQRNGGPTPAPRGQQ